MPELLQLVKAPGNYGVSSSGGARGRTFADGHLSTEGSKDLRLAHQGKQDLAPLGPLSVWLDVGCV